MAATPDTATLPQSSREATRPHWSQWYHARREQVAGERALATALQAATARWGEADLRIDTQAVHLKRDGAAGIPVWQDCAWALDGAILLVCADEPLVERRRTDGSADLLAVGMPLTIHAGDRLRFRPAALAQEVSIALIRPRHRGDPEPLARHSARIFQADGTKPTMAARDPRWAEAERLRFHSSPLLLKHFQPTTFAEIAAEAPFSATSIDDLRDHDGVLFRRFLAALPPDWIAPGVDVSIGVQRNELDVGWCPTPVGWHMDGTSRALKRPDGRPDLQRPGRTVEQMLACFGTGAPTRYLVGALTLPDPPLDVPPEETHSVWQRIIGDRLASRRLREWTMPGDALVSFGFGDFHTGSYARIPGWRCMIKAMRGRGGEPAHDRPRRNAVSWPIDAETWPTEPCGIFPDIRW